MTNLGPTKLIKLGQQNAWNYPPGITKSVAENLSSSDFLISLNFGVIFKKKKRLSNKCYKIISLSSWEFQFFLTRFYPVMLCKTYLFVTSLVET